MTFYLLSSLLSLVISLILFKSSTCSPVNFFSQVSVFLLLSSPLLFCSLLFLLSGQVCNTELYPTAHRYLYNLEGKEGGKERRGEKEGGDTGRGLRGQRGREGGTSESTGMLVVLGTKTDDFQTSLSVSVLLCSCFFNFI